jgi:hypothetical protein
VARFDRTIPPGGTGKITLSIDSNKVNGNFSKTARVHSNDFSQADLILTLKGSLRQRLALTPPRIFLRGPQDEKLEATIKIVSNVDRPVRVGQLSTDLAGKLKCDLKTVQEGKEYQLDVANLARSGVYNGEIRLKTDLPSKPELKIPVYVQVVGDINYYPPKIELGRINRKTNFGPGRVVSLWKNPGAPDFEVKRVGYNKTLFDVETRQQGDRYSVYLKPKVEALPKGEFNDEMVILTSSPRMPEVKVPVHGIMQ